MRSCYIYTRVSTEEQAEEGQSLEAQDKICREYAKSNGLTVLDVFQDPGRSGSDPNRPSLRALVTACKANPSVEAVVIQDIDRLARDTLLFLSIFRDFKENGISLKFVNQQNVDGSIDGMLIGTIQAAVSTYSAKQTGRKARATMIEKAKAGWYPSYAKIGYLNAKNPHPTSRTDENIIIFDPERGPVIRELLKKYSSGNYSILNLQEWLEETGFLTRSGKRMSYSAIGQVIRDPFYYGFFKWGGLEINGKHKPLIDKKIYELNQYVASKHRNFLIRERKHNFLLRGIVFCGACGMRHTAEWHTIKSNGGRVAYYHCNKRTGCREPYVEVNDLEIQVREHFRNLQFSQKFIELVTKKVQKVFNEGRSEVERQKKTLMNRRLGLEKRRNRLEDLLFDGTINREVFKRKHGDFQSRMDSLQSQIEDLDRKHNFDVHLVEEVLAFTRNIYQTYKSAPPFLKRHYLRFFYEKLLVGNKLITNDQPSPFFAALRQENAVIIRQGWLR